MAKQQKSKLELLQDVPLFGGLQQEQLESLTALLTEHDYGKGSIIVSEDDPGDALYVLVDGDVKVTLHGENGREVILNTLEAGDFFGEMSLIDGEERSANVICIKKSKILRLARREFLKVIRTHPSIAVNVMSEICVRLRKADAAIGNLALLDVYGRVARFILEISEEEGDEVEEGFIIPKLPTQQNIASQIGTSRETVSRALSEFQRRGFIEQRGRGLLVRASLTVSAASKTK